MTPRIQKAIDIFLDAINQGTLAKGSCAACAVGNLVANGIGGKIYKKNNDFDLRFYFDCDKENSYWGRLFYTADGRQRFNEESIFYEKAIENIKATDFTLKELMKIEYAFETNTCIDFNIYNNYSKEEIRKDQIKGLEAVVKVMLEFDEQRDDVKEVFTSKAELIPLI